jgi:hypothetical protein
MVTLVAHSRSPPRTRQNGEPFARIGEHVGQRNLAVTANTYTHVLTDEAELDYAGLLVSHSYAAPGS